MLVDLGRTLVIIGVVMTLFGSLLWLNGGSLKNIPIGRLPGDILIEKENFTFYLPLTTGILLSLAVSAVLWLSKLVFR